MNECSGLGIAMTLIAVLAFSLVCLGAWCMRLQVTLDWVKAVQRTQEQFARFESMSEQIERAYDDGAEKMRERCASMCELASFDVICGSNEYAQGRKMGAYVCSERIRALETRSGK